jgi:hypothetical protein
MQTDFRVEWVPLPTGREGEWRNAIELIAEIMKGYFMEMQFEDLNEYRFAWIDPNKQGTQYGSFLFNDPAEARPTEAAMKNAFSDYVIWLEDREHNRVEIPKS